MIEHKPRLVLDMDVLARAEHGETFRGWGRLCAGLAQSELFDVEFSVSPECADRADDFLHGFGISRPRARSRGPLTGQPEIVLHLGGARAEQRPADDSVVAANIIYKTFATGPSEPVDSAPDSSLAMVRGLDTRTLVIVCDAQVRDDLLRLRPDLSPAQIAVVPLAPSVDTGRALSMLTDVLMDAARRFRSRPASLLWQYPAAIPSDAAAPASFLGFHNGAAGPPFGLSVRDGSAIRLGWSDTLPGSGAAGRTEGGVRARGLLKEGSADLPLVSYVTVVRNNVATLGRAIESVQRQTYANVEHIVLDGASTDGTVELILRNADRLDYFVSEPDKGLYDAINKAVPLARGQLICILNSDDWLEPHAAEIAVRRMRHRTESAALLATGAVIYNLAGDVEVEWPPMFVHPGSYFACANICHNGLYATRRAYERAGVYDTTFRIAADFKWIMACVDAGVDFVYTREVTVNYSLGGTSGDARGHSLECQRVVAERFPFLSRQEVQGLYDSYFLFEHHSHEQADQRHEPLTTLLRRLFAEHTGQPDFQAALTWAAMTKLEHPSDRQVSIASTASEGERTARIPSVGRSAKDLAKSLLYRSPRLYRAALRGYARWRR